MAKTKKQREKELRKKRKDQEKLKKKRRDDSQRASGLKAANPIMSDLTELLAETSVGTAQILQLAAKEELSPEEIAERLGIDSEEAVAAIEKLLALPKEIVELLLKSPGLLEKEGTLRMIQSGVKSQLAAARRDAKRRL